jgi:hypothetical protein
MTGTWISQDSRRLWSWDFRTYYGLAVGVLGGQPSMNDACFTIEDLHASSGIYTRRGSGLGCYPFARPSATQLAAPAFTANSYSAGASESTDFPAPGGGNGTIATMPEYNGRIPGGNGAAGNASPSPVYYHIAPAASFFSSADPAFFPERYPTANDAPTLTNWCSTEILGIRTTSNGLPINYPIYLCRTRFNQ